MVDYHELIAALSLMGEFRLFLDSSWYIEHLRENKTTLWSWQISTSTYKRTPKPLIFDHVHQARVHDRVIQYAPQSHIASKIVYKRPRTVQQPYSVW